MFASFFMVDLLRLSHFGIMLLFALFVSMALACLTQRTASNWIKYTLWSFDAFCGDQRWRGLADVPHLALNVVRGGRVRRAQCRFSRPPSRNTFRPMFDSFFAAMLHSISAEVAQLVEQPIRNRQVPGSSPGLGSRFPGSVCCGQFIPILCLNFPLKRLNKRMFRSRISFDAAPAV